MQGNISDSQALFRSSVLIILEMASLDTLCSAVLRDLRKIDFAPLQCRINPLNASVALI